MLQVCVAKEKKETKEKKESFNAETIKKRTNVQNVTVLAILEPLEFKNFSCRLTVSGGAGVGDRTYKRIRGSGGGVSQIGRDTKWKNVSNLSQNIDIVSKKLIYTLYGDYFSINLTFCLGTYYRQLPDNANVTDCNQDCLGFYVIIWCSGITLLVGLFV